MGKGALKKPINLAIYLFIACFLFLAIYSFLPSGNGNPKEIEIKAGSSLLSIADNLKKEGLIRSKGVFIALAFLTGKVKKLKAGLYEISPNLSPYKILNMIAKGESKIVKVTIPEGFTIKQIGKRLEEAGLVSQNEFVALAQNAPVYLRAIVSAPTANLEGFLFPDTYFFPKGVDKERILKTFLENFRYKVLDKFWGKGVLPFYDTLKLASLVEWEAKHDEERRLIAGVLLNRLKKGIKLECDATVQYILPEHKEMITYKDLELNSPYNTYRVKGLPPTPICNPGIPSIEAALNPEPTDYLFYVALPNGYHIFSRTAEEHYRAVEKAREMWRKEKG
ncbi:endolytic transglycosylase MltG [bacterium]|nr:endolytic transglycosylase MltG [bacterium]